MVEPSVLAISILVILVAYTVKGFTGFGPALISVPLLSIFLDIKFVLPVVLLLDLVSSSIILWQERGKVQLRGALPILLFYVLGTLAGYFILVSISASVLEAALGAFIIIFAIRIFLRKNTSKLSRRLDTYAKSAAGLGSGILGSLFGTNGPPLVIYYSRTLEDKKQIRAATAPFFVIDCLWRGGMYAFIGMFSASTFEFFGYLLIPLLIGVFIGSKLHLRVGKEAFTKAVALILIIAGLRLLL
ncbi:MAG: sulfite exporter TauE/SafE family protein [archaeon]